MVLSFSVTVMRLGQRWKSQSGPGRILPWLNPELASTRSPFVRLGRPLRLVRACRDRTSRATVTVVRDRFRIVLRDRRCPVISGHVRRARSRS